MRFSPQVTCPLCKREFDYDYMNPPGVKPMGLIQERASSGSATPSGTHAGKKFERRNVVCPYCRGTFGIDVETF